MSELVKEIGLSGGPVICICCWNQHKAEIEQALKDGECMSCGGELDYSINMELQPLCYACSRGDGGVWS